MRIRQAFVLIALLPWAALANDHVIPVEIKEIFVPKGFDNNDEVIVVIDGSVVDGCLTIDETRLIYDDAEATFTVQQFTAPAFKPCLPLRTFTEEVSLGVLPAGRYDIVDWAGGAQAVLEIAESKKLRTDAHLYAPVESIEVRHDGESGVTSFVLDGEFENTCMRMDRVEVVDSGRTKEILPIMKPVDGNCENREVLFSWYGALPPQEPGRYLAHVRSFSGKGVNLVFDVN